MKEVREKNVALKISIMHVLLCVVMRELSSGV